MRILSRFESASFGLRVVVRTQMKSLLYISVALTMILAATPVQAASGTCDWVVGGPHTMLASVAANGVDGVDGCWVNTSAISTSTTSVGGLHDIDVYWYDANGNFLSGDCATTSTDESCSGPGGAAYAEVVAFTGVMGSTTYS